MNRLLMLISIISLVGCASQPVPVVSPFPSIPDDLKIACPDLKTVDEKTQKLSDIVDTVSDNYKTYYDCKARVDDWNEWYATQKNIHDKIK
jgi:hypothetical protein